MKPRLFEDIPVGVGIIYEGERIRKADTHVEFGGTEVPYKLEFLEVKPIEEVEDGKIEIVGPDIKDLKEGGTYPIGIHIEIAGKELDKDLEGIFEREIHKYINWLEGMMHIASRDIIWIRLSKDSFKKGLNSFECVGKVLQRLYKAEFPIIEKVQTTFLTDEQRIQDLLKEAKKCWEERDSRALGLRDEDVEEFYGCTLCQSFAPSHVCIITPSRPSLCGSITWFDARAAVRINPRGHSFIVEKGECVDEIKGEWTGANAKVDEKSMGAFNRVYLHSIFEYPHTSCGCFEAIAIYVPEVDGIAIIHREFKGPGVTGLPFSTLAGEAGGGRQMEGFVGISFSYMRSPKFLRADGG